MEHHQHPDGVRKLTQMANDGTLEALFANERVTIYGVPDQIAVSMRKENQ